MTKSELKNMADKLFWQYERDKFNYSGQYCYATELVFHFADYVASLSDSRLCEFLATEDEKSAAEFRKVLQNGIDRWLGENVKTMLIM